MLYEVITALRVRLTFCRAFSILFIASPVRLDGLLGELAILHGVAHPPPFDLPLLRSPLGIRAARRREGGDLARITSYNVCYTKLLRLPVVFAELALRGAAEQAEADASFRGERERHVSQIEAGLIKRYLRESGGNVSAAARLAGVPRRTFYRMLSRHGLSGAEFQKG